MAKPRKLFSCCSLLMAIMFGLSSSVQLNDPDWYFWFPLYSCACIVNLLNWRISPKGSIKHIAKVALCLGVVLFLKVVVEDFVKPNDHKPGKKREDGKAVAYGMASLVGFSYGLPFVFFVIQKGEMQF
ncbi:sequence-specific DNA binding transcription factor, zinc ion binding isoform 1 [Hibiscus syriacus]|uniref:Sequence-specific DNA binding transcription factor, zinc ion binding isoform 1 n=1 Tax=Hibiscus syriacus TaxID=106335 RepID=A0A6A2ZMR6_HIBSY|nr:sequence-specific DNA binding transcription factor, zinc ion binding isoform 1 [Hibiscus syriacus]